MAVEFRFQVPPPVYDPRYLSRFIRDLTIALNSLEAVDFEEFTFIQLDQCPTSGNALPVGTVFSDGGVLKIVLKGVAYPGSQHAVGHVNSVTIAVT